MEQTESHKPTTLTPLDTVPSVFMIIHDQDGVRGMYGGDNLVLAKLISQAVDRFPDHVKRRQDPIIPLGQDIYDVTWEFLLMVRGAFTFLTPNDVFQFDKVMPESLRYSFVVTH